MSIDHDLHQMLFQQREAQTQHLEYNQEFQYYNAIASGDIENVSRYFMKEDDQAYSGDEYGKLSGDSLRNTRYHFVVAVALITRICVEHGMERETAYTLSDIFIQKMDHLQTVSQVAALHNTMVVDFTKRMQKQKKENAYSIYVMRAIEYISAHLHDKLQIAEIAKAVSIHRGYLSTLFYRETGIQLHSYIMSQKIQAAAQLITTSDMPYSEIASYFSFSSQSHFIQCFRNETGYTPRQYRILFYHSSEV